MRFFFFSFSLIYLSYHHLAHTSNATTHYNNSCFHDKLYVSSIVPSTSCTCSSNRHSYPLRSHQYLHQTVKKTKAKWVNDLPEVMQLLKGRLRSMFYCLCPSEVSAFLGAVIYCGGNHWSSLGCRVGAGWMLRRYRRKGKKFSLLTILYASGLLLRTLKKKVTLFNP